MTLAVADTLLEVKATVVALGVAVGGIPMAVTAGAGTPGMPLLLPGVSQNLDLHLPRQSVNSVGLRTTVCVAVAVWTTVWS